jgi:membrane-anchored protein YejM (alkaline phosphatase superfamily)
VAKTNKPVEAETAAEVPPEPRWLFYGVSFVVPIAGIVLGALYLSKADEANKEFGKYCLIAALVNFALGVSAILCMVLFYAAFFAVYIALIAGMIGVAAGGGL